MKLKDVDGEQAEQKTAGNEVNKPVNLNDSDSVMSGSNSHQNFDSHRGMMEREYYQQYEQDEFVENESNKSDLIDEGTMNVFGFNDDLTLDDRVII